MPAPAHIPPDLVAMMARGVSAIVASRDSANLPSLMRAMGSAVTDEGRSITVYVSRRQAGQLIADIAFSGHVAVVFSEPATHRTVQVKATQATLRDATAQDETVLTAYLRSMEHELALVRIAPQLTRAMLAHRLEDVVAIQFTPEQAFDQTPGPKAGARLAGSKP